MHPVVFEDSAQSLNRIFGTELKVEHGSDRALARGERLEENLSDSASGYLAKSSPERQTTVVPRTGGRTGAAVRLRCAAAGIDIILVGNRSDGRSAALLGLPCARRASALAKDSLSRMIE